MQAIKCKLVGINPIGGQWTGKDTEEMVKLCDNAELKVGLSLRLNYFDHSRHGILNINKVKDS